jgi:hypothetical protein
MTTTTNTNGNGAPTTAGALKKRHPMIAFAAGVVAPGLGFLLTARPVAAAFTALVSLAVSIVVPVLVIDGVVGSVDLLPSLVAFAMMFVSVISSALSAAFAFRDPPRVFRPYEHPWWAIGFGLFSLIGSLQFRWHVVGDNVAAFDFSMSTALRPSVAELDRLVIVKRGFEPARVAINDLVAVRADSHSFPRNPALEPSQPSRRGFARVIALPGSTVEVKEDGGVVVDGFPVIAAPCPATVPAEGHVCIAERQATTRGEAQRMTTATSFARAFAPTAVGAGYVFVLPDDRGRKLYAPAGLVAVGDLEGLVVPARNKR